MNWKRMWHDTCQTLNKFLFYVLNKEPDSPPQNVEVLEVTATEISLRWSPPEKPNGIITHYEVMYHNASTLILKNTTETNLLLNGLKPYTLYNISVRAFTRLGHGNQSSPLLAVRTAETGKYGMLEHFYFCGFDFKASLLKRSPIFEIDRIYFWYRIQLILYNLYTAFHIIKKNSKFQNNSQYKCIINTRKLVSKIMK